VVVVDEQHRFGVSARDRLARKAGASRKAPHMLYMTATPIPRTLALTVYGDLDVSTIAAGPQGRSPVVTRLVDESRRADGYEFVLKQLDRGRQVYVVCPAIEESESIQAATAVAEAERLAGGEFRDYRVAVLHGQLKPARREQTMAAYDHVFDEARYAAMADKLHALLYVDLDRASTQHAQRASLLHATSAVPDEDAEYDFLLSLGGTHHG